MTQSQKACFVIAPIGPDGSDVRKRSDQVLRHIIKKALEPRYLVERADEINRSGTIIAQIVERVFKADLVVADLSGPNANVFYEVAIRHATKKPTVHLAAASDDPPFDVNQIRVIKFNLSDPDSIEEAQRRLREQVDGIEAGQEVTTPVQFAQILQSLERGDSREKQLLEIFKGLSQGVEALQSQVAHVEKILSHAPFAALAEYGFLPTGNLAWLTPTANSAVPSLPLPVPSLGIGGGSTEPVGVGNRESRPVPSSPVSGKNSGPK